MKREFNIFFYSTSGTEEAFRQMEPLIACLVQFDCNIFYSAKCIDNTLHIQEYSGIRTTLTEYTKNYEENCTVFITFSNKDTLYLRRIIGNRKNYSILFRPRGIVPEESFLKHHSLIKKWILDYQEQKAIAASDCFCFLSKKQQLHYISKYFYNQDIFSKSIVVHNYLPFSPRYFPQKSDDSTIRIVYSGGFSKWQQIDSIFQLIADIHSQLENIEFYICTLEDNNNLAAALIDQYSIRDFTKVRNLNQEELVNSISDYDVGIILRSNSIVNITSSPFKVIDYLNAGLGIIMSDNIGDYCEILSDRDYVYFVKCNSNSNFEFDIEKLIDFLVKIKTKKKDQIASDLESLLNLKKEIEQLLCFLSREIG